MSQKIYFVLISDTSYKDSFGTKFSFYNDFKGANTSGHDMSHFCENRSIVAVTLYSTLPAVFANTTSIFVDFKYNEKQ